MKRFIYSAVFAAAAAPTAALAQSECGDVSITEMNWASAQVTTAVAEFIMEQGYGCNVEVVQSDTIPAMTSVAENGEPDIVTELWINSAGDAYKDLRDEGKLVQAANVLDPGGLEGWWVPTYLAEEHPELKTIEGVMEHPDWVGDRFVNCPEGWGCRVVNDNLINALDLDDSMEIFNAGSGQVLNASMADAVEAEEPWFGYQFGPSVPLGKYDMTRVKIGEVKPDVHAANQNPDNPEPGVSDFPPGPIVTATTATFKDEHPDVFEFLNNMSIKSSNMSQLLAWKDENNASADEAAVQYLTEYQDTWTGWISDEAKSNLSSVLQQG